MIYAALLLQLRFLPSPRRAATTIGKPVLNTTSQFENEKLALDNCEREAVHIPGRVQSPIAVVGFVRADFKVACFSDNCETLLGLPADKMLGNDLKDVFANRKLIHGIRGALSLPSIKSQRERIGRFAVQENGEQQFEVALSLGGELGILEIEPVNSSSDQANSSLFHVRTMLFRYSM